MNLKFCEKVLLLFNTDYSFSQVHVYPPHKRKDAERDKVALPHKATHLIEVNNSGFSVKFEDFRNRYYGASVNLILDHPEFKEYPFLSGHSLQISTDTCGFTEILRNSTLDSGLSSNKTFSFDLYTNAWYQNHYRLVPDKSPFISERILNYKEFWDSPKTSSMRPGSVYIDRWGDIYLALTDKVYSSVIGNGYSGGNGNYTLYYSYNVLHYDEKKPATVMAYLGNSKNILEYLPGIAQDSTTFQKFFENLFLRDYNDFSVFQMGVDFLRIKGYSNGHFVKLLDIPNYESLYKSLGSWYGLKEMLFSLSKRYSSVGQRSQDSISHYENFFYVTQEKEPKDLCSILSKEEKSIYRDYILKTILEWKNGPSTYDLENYPRFYTPEKDDKKFTYSEICDFMIWRVRRSYLKVGIRDYWIDVNTFLSLGIFKNENDLINEFEKIRKL